MVSDGGWNVKPRCGGHGVHSSYSQGSWCTSEGFGEAAVRGVDCEGLAVDGDTGEVGISRSANYIWREGATVGKTPFSGVAGSLLSCEGGARC